MPLLNTHHERGSMPWLTVRSDDQYQSERSHPQRAARVVPPGYVPVFVPLLAPRDSSAPMAAAFSVPGPSHEKTVRAEDRFKVIGYAATHLGVNGEVVRVHPVSTGTSKPGWTCITAGLKPCVAVAVAGVPLDDEGRCKRGGTVRIFHVAVGNIDPAATVRACIESLHNRGLAVTVAMRGGNPSVGSVRLAQELRELMKEMPVSIAFDTMGTSRSSDGDVLGVGIDAATHSPYFVTHLRAPPT